MHDPKLTWFELKFGDLTKNETDMAFELLKGNTTVTFLSLIDMHLYKLNNVGLVGIVASPKAAIACLVDLLRENNTICKLELNTERFEDAIVFDVVEMLRGTPTLEWIKIFGNLKTAIIKSAHALVDVIATHPSLKTVRICCISFIYVRAGFGRLMTENQTLEKLTFFLCDFHSSDGAAMVKGLHTNTSLNWVEFRYSTMGSDVEVAFTDLFRSNNTLVEFDIVNSILGDEYIVSIINSLKHNTSLKWLYLDRGCWNNTDVVEAARSTMEHNDTLTCLQNCSSTNPEMKAICRAEYRNKSLFEILMESNYEKSDWILKDEENAKRQRLK